MRALIVILIFLTGSPVYSQKKIYFTKVASDKARKVYFETYAGDTDNWIHFINSPFKADIKVHIKETCFQADVEFVSSIDLDADWVKITKHSAEADSRIYISSYFNENARSIYITDNPYKADIVICMDKDEFLEGLDDDEKEVTIQKMVAAALYEGLFEADNPSTKKNREKLKSAHETLELAGNNLNELRENLGKTIVFDSLASNIDYLQRRKDKALDISSYVTESKQTLELYQEGYHGICGTVRDSLSRVIQSLEIVLLDLRDADRRIDLAIRYNDSENRLTDLTKALEYFDSALKGTIRANSRIERIDQSIVDCQ